MEFVTIDGRNSKDLDDAIRISRRGSGWRVEVAVADVAAAVAQGGIIDREAAARGFTIYRAEQAARPMLPSEISENDCSLIAGRPRSVVAVGIDLDARLETTSVDVARSEIAVGRRFDHEGAVLAAAQGGRDGEMLREAMTLAEALSAKRRAAGAMSFFSPDRGLVSNEEGRVLQLGRSAPAYLLVCETMILANTALAMRLAGRGIQILYRNHRARLTANRESLMDDIALMQSGLLAPTIFESRRGLVTERAALGTSVEGHFTLNLPVYAWFTSPIRRYADLVNHRILVADLAGLPAPYSAAELEEVARTLNARYREESERAGEALKRRAARAAIGAVTSGELRSLDASGFAQAVKAAAGGTDFGEGFLDEARRRSQAGELTGKDLYRLIFAEGASAAGARSVVAAHLIARPEAACAILNYAQSIAAWTAPEETVTEGVLRDGTPAFAVRLSGGFSGAAPEAAAWGLQKRSASQRALAVALVRMAGGEPPRDWTEIPAIGARMLPTGQAVSGDPKGALYTVCQRRRWAPPAFAIERIGPDHAHKFVCTVSVATDQGGCEARGEGTNRKLAEATAAAALIAQLSLRERAVA